MARLRAVLFDVGGTLIESPSLDPWHDDVFANLRREFGEVDWVEELCHADIRRFSADEPYRQDTLGWYRTWLDEHHIYMRDDDVERLRKAFAAPHPASFHLTEGAGEALRFCHRRGLKVILITNTISTNSEEVHREWARLGFGEIVDGAVSSASAGWRKPHPAIFREALRIGDARPEDAVMVGDELDADIAGAQALRIRTVWKTTANRDDVRPDVEISSLVELPRVLTNWL